MKRLVLVVGIILGTCISAAVVNAEPVACLAGAPEASGDAANLAAVSSSITTQCPCASFDGTQHRGHRAYVSCVTGVVRQALRDKTLRSPCRRAAIYASGQSTCGYPSSQGRRPCIHTNSRGKISCRVRPEKSCRGDRNAFCGARSACLNAADTDLDGLLTPADSGACKPQNCAAQMTQWQARKVNWQEDCFDQCTNPSTIEECSIGCTIGGVTLDPIFQSEDAVCRSNPLTTCEELHTGMLEWCTAHPEPAQICLDGCTADAICETRCLEVYNCERAALESYQYCVRTY